MENLGALAEGDLMSQAEEIVRDYEAFIVDNDQCVEAYVLYWVSF